MKQPKLKIVTVVGTRPEIIRLSRTMELLDKYVLPNNLLVYQRCKYIVEENIRLLDACFDLEQGNLKMSEVG